MKTKSTIWITSLLTIVIALVMSSLVSKDSNQSAFATLLEGNLQAEKNNLGGELMKTAEICNNGIDDNGDGLVDANDPDCAKTPIQNANDQEQPILQLDTNRPGFNITTAQSLDNGEVSKKQSDILMQSINDENLVKRIFPLILKKLDGPTILKKVDATQLLEKILPYVKIKITEVSNGPIPISKGCAKILGVIGSCGGDPQSSTARCGPEDGIAVGGAFEYYRDGDGVVQLNTGLSGTDGWSASGLFTENGDIGATVLCMKIEAVTPSGGVDVR